MVGIFVFAVPIADVVVVFVVVVVVLKGHSVLQLIRMALVLHRNCPLTILGSPEQ